MKDIRTVLLEVYELRVIVCKEKIKLLKQKIDNPTREYDEAINLCSGQIIAYDNTINILQNFIALEREN